ncbi:STAS domain-containing protein [Streptomyces sp. NP160]|uniref:STAS domain-containing protein n=1 Tax=Streptomyces sp. NP160 TaxID=2586637 RepID=UPI00111A0BF1|nr:STAS domain-containing protein [Streptomyces sp. NP160]TNM67154.1 STAS domain-containing protein [Streptomyces sp. NP160]
MSQPPPPPQDPCPAPHLLHSVRSEGSSAALRWTGSGVVVELSGDLDLTCRDQLAHVAHLLARWSHRAVVDASRVTFVDVSGLRAVLDLAPPGGSLLVLEPSRPLLRLIDLLRQSTGWPPVLAVGPPERALVLRRPAPEPAARGVVDLAAHAELPTPRSR